MIYFVTGDGREKVQKTSHGLVEALQKKRPDAHLFRITGGEWDRRAFEGVAFSQGLFERKYIIVLESLFENEEAAEYIQEILADLRAAEHAFVVVEYSPKAPIKNTIKKFAERVWEIAATEKVFKKEFNIFSLTDALGERNKARLWVLYQKALMNGSEPEEIHGILFWQIKSLLSAARSKDAAEAGLKPFVWGKSQGFLKNYTPDELKKISSTMVGLYHNSRLESVPLEISLEEFILRA